MISFVKLPQSLPESEQKLFEFILAATKHLDVTLRVAGGWVRDKMLGKPSDDIDITIETPSDKPYITGEQLATVIAQATHAAQHPHVSVIKTNPEKSKHIETAQVTVMGHQLEFCHLRKDDYSVCSSVQRTPAVAVATPLEDAQRRDFTCNALFYNLHTGMVEDFVGGLSDLKARRLRCPLEPQETFCDDPLRMLRGVRFAGRLGFRIDECIGRTILSGIEHNEPFFTHENEKMLFRPLAWELLRKVSRERYGIEVGKMMQGPSPEMCANVLFQVDLLYSTVLIEMYPKKQKKNVSAVQLTHAELYERVVTIISPKYWNDCYARTAPLMKVALQEFGLKEHDRLITSLAAVLIVPLVCMESQHISLQERTKAVVQNGLKLSKNVSDDVTAFLVAIKTIGEDGIQMIKQFVLSDQQQTEQETTTFARVSGPLRAKIFTALRYINKLSLPVTMSLFHVIGTLAFSDAKAKTDFFVQSVVADGPLFSCGNLVPLLRGDKMTELFSKLPANLISELLTVQLQYMVDNPNCTEDNVKQYLLSLVQYQNFV
jgi:tRNA nucleotidyltransferase/poly(A) polymerase